MIPFTKAHACGNDFLIVTEEAARGSDWAELTRRLCARNTGIGADGIEFFAWTGPKSGRIRLHNADGSIAEISGNGTRCVAAWMAAERGFQPGDEVEIATDAGLRVCRVNALRTDGEFTVEVTAGMGIPVFAPKTVTLADGDEGRGRRGLHRQSALCDCGGQREFAVSGLSWQTDRHGDLHAHGFPSSDQRGVCAHRQRARDRDSHLRARRGTDDFVRHGQLGLGHRGNRVGIGQSPLTVVAPGGAQTVEWDGPGAELKLTGPAALIARGEAW